MISRKRSPRSRRVHTARLLLEDLERRVVLSTPSAQLNLVIARPPGFHVNGTIPNPEGGSTPLVGGSLTPVGLTPDQIRTAYGINNIVFGGVTGDGTGQTIAIADAYDNPAFPNSTDPNFSTGDLAQFDKQFGLPDPPSFTKYNQSGATGTLPGTDPAGQGNPLGNWELEEALDIEWAHAIAPKASIDLVEANSGTNADLFATVAVAANLTGVSAVSMSWGLYEIGKESAFDSAFVTPSGHQGVTFVAATGDTGSPGTYPAFSPNVLAVGGTTLSLNGDNSIASEDAWSGSGGGTSQYEPEPSYQSGVQSTGQRTIPDVAFDADPNSGVAVYDSWNDIDGSGPWIQIGGTSLAAPAWAGLIAIANQGRGGASLDGASQTLPALYQLPAADFHDITSGSDGGFSAGPGYDEVTGLGTPNASLLVPALAAYGTATNLAITAQPPSSIIAGDSFGIVVAAENSAGNIDTTFHGTITLGLGSNPGGATLGGTTSVAAVNGVAVFDGLTLNNLGNGYTLRVSSALPTLTTAPFNVTANTTPWAGTFYPVPTDASLRKAISQAESNGFADNVIVLEGADYALTNAALGQLVIQNTSSLANKALTIVGQGPSSTIIGGGPGWKDRVAEVVGTTSAGTTVVFQDLAIEHGDAQGGGIVGGTAALGGGVLVDGASVTMTEVAVASNLAAGRSGGPGPNGPHAGAGGTGGTGDDAHGGGLYLASGSLTLNGVTLSNNVARGGGGGTGGMGGSGVVPGHPSQQQPGGAGGAGSVGGTAAGGGVYVAGGQLVLAGVTFSHDQAVGGVGGTGGIGGNGGVNQPGGAGGAGGAAGPAAGGAIYLAQGAITLTSSTLEGNAAVGGAGGLGGAGGSGGSAFASATGIGTTLLGAPTGGVGAAAPAGPGAFGGNGGAGGLGAAGRGGGVYAAGGTLTLTDMALSANRAVGGDGGRGGQGGHGEVGSYGGLLTGLGTLAGVTGGKGGQGGNAGDGSGGGVYVAGGAITLLDGTLNANLARGGRGGNGGTGGSGALAGGLSGLTGLVRRETAARGGIGSLTTGLTGLTGPTGPAAKTGGDGGNGGNGGIGRGGGVYVGGGSLTLLNTTVADNNAQGGRGGSGGPGGPGGSLGMGNGLTGLSGSTGRTIAGGLTITGAAAAGAYVGGGLVTFDNSTVALNSLIANGDGTSGTGDGVVQVAGTVVANSTLFAGNGTDDYIGSGTANNSLFQTAPSNGTISGSANLIGVNPMLDPNGLQNNGGPTQTIALLPGSPALGAGSNPEGLLTDQRGFAPRTSASSGTDIGADQLGATADATTPAVTLQAATVTAANSTALNPYTFTLTFSDNVAVDAASLRGAVVQVILPSGAPITATVVGSSASGASDPLGNAGSIVVTYEIAPPGGSWTAADVGTYVVMRGGAPVTDLAGNAVASGEVGTFSVSGLTEVPSSLLDAGFEAPSVGSGAFGDFQYDPTGTPWTYTGYAGVSGNGSGFTAGNPGAPEGAQVGYVQMTGSLSQNVPGWTAGTYQINFAAAQRANYQSSRQDFQVLVDGNVVGTFTPTGPSYATYTTAAFSVTAGAHTIVFQGLNGAGGDNTAFLDDVQVVQAAPPPTGLIDGGFEAPSVGNGAFGAFQYDPSNTPWTYTGYAGVSGNGSGFTAGNPNAPEGTQVGLLQMTGSISQVVAGLPAGTYQIGFEAAQRANYQTSRQDFRVLVDGNAVGTFTPTGPSYVPYMTNTFTVTAGTHTVVFQGLDGAGGDNTAFLDRVEVSQATA